MAYKRVPIDILPGVQPIPDSTPSATRHFTASTGIRFDNGLPEKVGGYTSIMFDGDKEIVGCARTIHSQFIGNSLWYNVGTNERLYAWTGATLSNITPLVATTTAIANSLDSNYGTLGADPVATVNGSTTLTITSAAHVLQVGDTVDLSGSSAVNGVPSGEINATHIVRTVPDANSYTVIVGTAATSTGSGGGASVVEATKVVTVNQTAHGFANGDRVKILAATTFAGIPAAEINAEHEIRNVSTNAYDIAVSTAATSLVSGGGGASTTVQGQIAAGECDASTGEGYGMGQYGVGQYGVSKTSSSLNVLPRVWSMDRFGDLVIMTPGGQTGLYSWDGDNTAAPTLVSNAPTAIDYAFVDKNIVVTLGASGVVNRVQWSDQGALTTWTATAQNFAGSDDIENADKFISHANARGVNLLFTSTQVWTMRFIDRPFVWEFKQLESARGLIAQNARIAVGGIVYWMGQDNWYMYNGGVVQVIPSNSGGESTVRDYVFTDINDTQKNKVWCQYIKMFNEIQWHYPSSNSLEPDRVVRLSLDDFVWCTDEITRTAGEYPVSKTQTPIMIDDSNVVYRHESGVNADGAPLAWSLTSPLFSASGEQVEVGGIIPDSIQTGNIEIDIKAQPYPQSSAANVQNVTNQTITTTTPKIDFLVSGKFWQYTLSQEVLNGNWKAGMWWQLVQKGTPEDAGHRS